MIAHRPPSSPLVLAALSIVVAASTLSACSRAHRRAAPPTEAGQRVAPAVRARGPSDVAPVYPVKSVAPNPVAERFCDVVDDLPARRRGACTHAPPGASLASECVRTLSFALATGAVTLTSPDVEVCATAMDAATSACDRASADRVPLPAACDGIVHGTLGEGEACRSSLDCTAHLHCRGAGPTDMGVCAPPLERGACGGSVDTLATLTRQDAADAAHPECAGTCWRNRCADRVGEPMQPPSHLARKQEARATPISTVR